MTSSQANWLQKMTQKTASLRPTAWFGSYAMHHLDRLVLRLTNSHASLTSMMTGLPIVTLTTIGAKSGQPRSVPLVGILEGENIVLIASNWGQKHHPAWYYNLKKHPEATVTVNGRSQPYVAREAVGEEREVLFQKAVQLYAGYAAYKQRTGGRQIPVMVLKVKGEE